MSIFTKTKQSPFEDQFPAMRRQLGVTGDTTVREGSERAPYLDAIERVCVRLEELEQRGSR